MQLPKNLLVSLAISFLALFVSSCTGHLIGTDLGDEFGFHSDTLVPMWRHEIIKSSNMKSTFAPVRVGSRVMCIGRDSIFCLDTATGLRFWTSARTERATVPTTLATEEGNVLVIGVRNARLHDTQNGRVIWEVSPGPGGGIVNASYLRGVAEGRLYLVYWYNQGPNIDSRRVVCLDMSSGSELWRVPLDKKLAELDAGYLPPNAHIFSVSAATDGVYIGVNEIRVGGDIVKTASMNKLDVHSGQVVWRSLVPAMDSTVLNYPGGWSQYGWMHGPVALCDDGGVIGVTGSCITKWDRAGAIEYRYVMIHEGIAAHVESSQASFYDNGIFYNVSGTDDGAGGSFAYAFDVRNRKMVWQRSVSPATGVLQSLAFPYPKTLSDKYYDVVSDGQWWWRFNRFTGELVHQTDLSDLPGAYGDRDYITSGMLIDGNSIYLGTDNAWYKGRVLER